MMARFKSWKLCLALLAVSWVLPLHASDGPGYVDSAPFLELVSEDAATVEVSLKGALLRALCAFDAELKQLCEGLESIQALVVSEERPDNAQRIRELMKSTEQRLLKRKWSPLVKMKEKDTSVIVLALEESESIRGLVVLTVDDEEMVFANISGVLDLNAIASIGEKLDIPGLDHLED